MTKLYIALEQALAVVSQHGQGWKAELHLAGNNTQCIAADPLRPEHGVPGDAVNPPRPRLRLAGAPMSAMRDPEASHLLTPQHAALRVIDSQPWQIAAVQSMDRTWC